MTKIENLGQWQLDKNVPNTKRFVEVKIWFTYPDPKQFIEFNPKERIKQIDSVHKTSLEKLIALNLFDEYESSGTKKRPIAVKTKIKFASLTQLNKLDFVKSISIESIDHAMQIKVSEVPYDKYFCVKMTVSIEIEGLAPKKQQIEKRFVLIKAISSDDAYEKLEKQKDNYSAPYLNSDGRFVRWRIDSFDDCYETDIINPNDFNNPAGVEVYSKLSTRKSKRRIIWDGKF